MQSIPWQATWFLSPDFFLFQFALKNITAETTLVLLKPLASDCLFFLVP